VTLVPPLKWPGGKAYLAKEIVARMCPHLHYVEVFGGGARVLLERDPNDESLWLPGHKGVSEMLNDIDEDLVVFWRVIQDTERFADFARMVQATPLSRTVFEEAKDKLQARKRSVYDWTRRAFDFFIVARQSRAGGFKGFTQMTRSRVRRGINGNASEWLGAVDGLPAIHERLRPVVLENLDFRRLIPQEDTPGTLFYLDPPYFPDTRTKNLYRHEMTIGDHQDLLSIIRVVKGKVILSGYRNACYDLALRDWNRHEFNLPNHLAGSRNKQRMTECLWMNYDLPAR
jgi:DNA adenine methylase